MESKHNIDDKLTSNLTVTNRHLDKYCWPTDDVVDRRKEIHSYLILLSINKGKCDPLFLLLNLQQGNGLVCPSTPP